MPPTAPKFSGPKLEGHIDTEVRDGPGLFARGEVLYPTISGTFVQATTMFRLDEAHFLLNYVAKAMHPPPTIEPGRKPNDPWYNQHRRKTR